MDEIVAKLANYTDSSPERWSEFIGLTAHNSKRPELGLCTLTGIACSSAGYHYLLFATEDGQVRKELAKAFFERHRLISIPQEALGILTSTTESHLEADEHTLSFAEDSEYRARPILHGELPRIPSERPFADTLLSLEFPEENQPHVWFPLLAGVRDVDCVLWLPRTGLFCIELKDWSLSAIKRLSLERFELKSGVPHSTRRSPWEQCQDAMFDLANTIKKDRRVWRNVGSWLSACVIFPRMLREEWLDRFLKQSSRRDQEDFVRQTSEATVLKEDLEDGASLVQRLNLVRNHPVTHAGPQIGLSLIHI